MIVGILKEIKNHEYRVGMTPAGVEMLVSAGHSVLVETKAGEGPGIGDAEYKTVGAKIIDKASEIFAKSDMIIKVKEPLEPEFPMMRKGQLMFTYFHLAGDEKLTRRVLDTGVVGIAYETIEDSQGRLPLLVPMSEVAGRLSIIEGAKFLERPQGGRGILLGGVPGTEPANVLIIGAGVVGSNAAAMAVGMGANTTIMDKDINRLRELDRIYQGRLRTLKSNPWNVRKAVKHADLVVGSVLVAGAKAPWVVTRGMLSTMRKGSVMVDVAIDQGGCFETSHPTTHAEPVFEVDGIVHYCVANMPGCVPRTSTFALTNETIPYAVELANKGWKKACKENHGLLTGLNVCNGKLTCKPVADVFKMPYTPPSEVLG
ncbi:MAG: alanine dehydrogenase [Deltaproteobacteria bacterium]|nr:alanine dehydrogenase [Deltaproteobacteria bacterium]